MRGANVCLYCVREASQGENIHVHPGRFYLTRAEDSKAKYVAEPRVGFQRSAPQNNFRRLIAAMIEPGNFCLDTVSFVPESESQPPLAFVLALLNSELADWYFSLGSTNSKVNEYQFRNLPCPRFRPDETPAETAAGVAAVDLLAAARPDLAVAVLEPLLADAPFPPAVRAAVVAAVDGIVTAEAARGVISRTDRSALSAAAQPYQDFLDTVFFRLAGLSDAEVAGLRKRYAAMN